MKKTLTMVLAFALIFALGIGATLAWLTATSDEVKNTFTTSDIDITLTETKGNANREFKMVPGHTIEKDPKATVVAGSEPCYLFVKVEKSSNFDSFMIYTMAAGWTQLTRTVTENGETKEEPVTGVFYREVSMKDEDQSFDVIGIIGADQKFVANKVLVKDTVTKADMNSLTADTYPTLTFTAYASQLYKNNTEKFTATEAWANVPTTTPTNPDLISTPDIE